MEKNLILSRLMNRKIFMFCFRVSFVRREEFLILSRLSNETKLIKKMN